MAKIVHGGGAQMSGSVGASTYTRNGLVRRRTNPTNTVSARRSEMQGNLSTFAAEWRNLTDSQRAAWVGVLTRVNSLGALITLSPLAAYVAVNCALAACGEPVVVLPPVFNPITSFSLVSADVQFGGGGVTQVMSLAVTNDSGAARKCLLEATPALSPGISNYLTSLRQIGSFTVADGDVDVDVLAAYKAVFGADMCGEDNVGKRIGFRMRDLNNGNPLPTGIISVLAVLGVPD